MQDRDDHRQTSSQGPGWREGRQEQGYRSGRDEGRSWEAPHEAQARPWSPSMDRYVGDSGGSYDERYNRGDLGQGHWGQGGGSYGQQDYSPSAQRSTWRQDQRYGDTGAAMGPGGQTDNLYGGGRGGYSGYGSSGQGQYGAGGFAQGGQGQSGYGRNYGQGPGGFGGGEHSGYGQPYGGAGRAQSYDADFDPHYLDWRRDQEASYDRDYHHWRETQLKRHDDDYRQWRDARRSKFHENFESWRTSRGGEASTGTHAAGVTGSAASGEALGAPADKQAEGAGKDEEH